MDELREQREYYKKLSYEACKKWKVAKDIEVALRKEWEEYRDLHEKYDRQLAEIDGRKTVYPLNVKKTTVKKDITLTRDQVLDLASKLGIVLNLEEESEDGEELDFEG
jgi:hypothetical protein